MMLKPVSVVMGKANIGQIFGVLMIRVKNGVMIACINNLFAKMSLHNNNVIQKYQIIKTKLKSVSQN